MPQRAAAVRKMIVDIPETSAIPPPRLPGRRPSGAYRLAIQAAHHHGCRPRIAAARPHRVPVLVGMLDVDEERGQVRRVGDAGDFATQRPHQETLGLARLLVDVVHRVIAEDIGAPSGPRGGRPGWRTRRP
ncbi:hypothetical protein G6F46_014505 [Rhizopus delemar]|nr:hypothetical protein G6F46_014505 [Rhizopus delemar]